MARMKITIGESNTVEATGDSLFVGQVTSVLAPLLEAMLIKIAVRDPESVKAALAELESAWDAFEMGKDFTGTYWKHKVEQ